MKYTRDEIEIRKVLDNKLNGKPFNEDQFLDYHLNRNEFNVQNTIITLTKNIFWGYYVDDCGKKWMELPTIMNKYHMPKENWEKSIMYLAKPDSRKFIRNDGSKIGGQFEIIIQHDGKRIDANTDAKFQETYNFGRTISHPWAHKILDIDPHFKNPNYTFKKDMGSVTIIE